jgi:nuclear pore complex protein Nup98-Nup96
MEELAIKGLDENGKCVVTSFSIIRQGYGRIFFEGPLDVANLNLDEIGKWFKLLVARSVN